MHVRVLGAGVVGLTTARTLQERGHRVDITATARTPNTTSDVAAAIHFPYLVEPRAKAGPWSRTSFELFRRHGEAAGVVMHRTFIATDEPDAPWWAPFVDEPAKLTAGPGGLAGWSCIVPVIHMPTYLRFLEEAFIHAGGRFEQRTATDLRGEAAAVDAVVNCTGLGAARLASDASMRPVRGQVVRVADGGIPMALLRDEPLTYVVPRSDGAIVGGTSEMGNANLAYDVAQENAMLARAHALSPGLGRVLERKVGLRPWRPSVRLEREGTVVHNYGHGGAGVTLSWGCAQDVAVLLSK